MPGQNVPPNGAVILSMVWNSWPTTSQDYDLLLYRQNGDGTVTLLTSSTGAQTGTQAPREWLIWVNNTGATARVGFAIQDYNRVQGLHPPSSTPRIDVFKWPLFGSVWNFDHHTTSGRLTHPGGITNAFSVAAICWQTYNLENYSSQGPTPDGRMQPDIAGHSVVTTSFSPFQGCAANSGFNGTSAATPHVAGAATLVKGAVPSATPAQVQAVLQERAVDLGAPGDDPQFGHGALRLGPPIAPPAVRAKWGDFDGDGKTDFGIMRNGLHFAIPSSGGPPIRVDGLAAPGDQPLVGDYNGDGRSDFGIMRPGLHFVVLSNGGGVRRVDGLAAPGDRALEGDYNGDGTWDFGIFRTGLHFVITAGGVRRVDGMAAANDLPLPWHR